uniref:Uncharacterized protein n=1 Tax=Canis lupus familiaris TaxID=9615 RepID=A0A8I3PC94_CANLF
ESKREGLTGEARKTVSHGTELGDGDQAEEILLRYLEQIRKKFLYSEPHKRIKEVLEEELYIKRDECHIKNPPAVALERIWSIKRNLPVGNLKPELPSRNSLLPQTTYYSRHGGLRSKILILLISAESLECAD